MRRTVAFALAAVLGLSPCLAACTGASGGSGGGGGSAADGAPAAQPKQPEPTSDAITLDEFEYTAGSSVVDGQRVVGFSFTNNSEYVVVNARLDMRFKDGVTVEQVRPLLGDDAEWICEQSYDPLTNDNIADKVVCGTSGWYEIGEGESSETSAFSFADYAGWLENGDIVELLEPDVLTIQFLCNDRIYTEYYDFKGESYSLSSETVDDLAWPDEDKAGSLPRPEGKHTFISGEWDDHVTVQAISMSRDEFEEYVEKLEDAGYSIEPEENSGFYADVMSPDEAYELTIGYSDPDGVMSISIDVAED